MKNVFGQDIVVGSWVYWDPTFGFPLLTPRNVPHSQRGQVIQLNLETSEALVHTGAGDVWVFADDIIAVDASRETSE